MVIFNVYIICLLYVFLLSMGSEIHCEFLLFWGGGCLVHSGKKVTVFYLNIYHFAQQEQSAIEKLKFIREKFNFIIGLKSVKIMAWKDWMLYHVSHKKQLVNNELSTFSSIELPMLKCVASFWGGESLMVYTLKQDS